MVHSQIILHIFKRKLSPATYILACMVIVLVGDVVWAMNNRWYAAIVTPRQPLQTKMSQLPILNNRPSQPVSEVHDTVIPPVVNGAAPVISQIDTKQPVVFLTIDDGAVKEQSEISMVQSAHIKASLFLADLFIHDNPAFFKGFLPLGSLIEDHTVTHRLFPQLSYSEQKKEICDQAELEEKEYGRRPILFRPPGGAYDSNTPLAAAACGMRAVVLWIAKANGGSMQYQIGNSLRPGDIVLMHFRPMFKQDLQAFIAAQNAAGLHTELLEDWLQ